MAFVKQPEPIEKIYYVVSSQGALKTVPVTIYFPFAEMQAGYSAQERVRTDDTAALDMQFTNGMFTTSDPLQQEILDNYHNGCTISTPGKYKGKILRPSARMLYNVTSQDPAIVGSQIANAIFVATGVHPNPSQAQAPTKITVNKIPRIMVDAVNVTVLMDVLFKEKGIKVDLPIEKADVVAILERENLISD